MRAPVSGCLSSNEFFQGSSLPSSLMARPGTPPAPPLAFSANAQRSPRLLWSCHDLSAGTPKAHRIELPSLPFSATRDPFRTLNICREWKIPSTASVSSSFSGTPHSLVSMIGMGSTLFCLAYLNSFSRYFTSSSFILPNTGDIRPSRFSLISANLSTSDCIHLSH